MDATSVGVSVSSKAHAQDVRTKMSKRGWIGVDLDGTLASYDGRGLSDIGHPLEPMVRLVKMLLNMDRDVRILTARAHDPKEVTKIKAWTLEHLGRELPVTASKDYEMIALFDDRAVGVARNIGMPCSECMGRYNG